MAADNALEQSFMAHVVEAIPAVALAGRVDQGQVRGCLSFKTLLRARPRLGYSQQTRPWQWSYRS